MIIWFVYDLFSPDAERARTPLLWTTWEMFARVRVTHNNYGLNATIIN